MDVKFQLRQESFCSLLNRVSSNDGSFQLLSLNDFLAFPRMTSDCQVRESYLRTKHILRRWIRRRKFPSITESFARTIRRKPRQTHARTCWKRVASMATTS